MISIFLYLPFCSHYDKHANFTLPSIIFDGETNDDYRNNPAVTMTTEKKIIKQ